MTTNRHQVTATPGALYDHAIARKRYRCDGPIASERHWIQPGDQYVASALPPNSDIGNTNWWHARLCMDCAPS